MLQHVGRFVQHGLVVQAHGKRQDARIHRAQPHQRGQPLHVVLQQGGQGLLGAGALGLAQLLVQLGAHRLGVERAVFGVNPVVQTQGVGDVVAAKVALAHEAAQDFVRGDQAQHPQCNVGRLLGGGARVTVGHADAPWGDRSDHPQGCDGLCRWQVLWRAAREF